jgi:hypothetical protein
MITVTLIREVKYDSFPSPTNPLTNQYNRTIMRSMYLFNKILILLFGVAISVQAVPPVLNYAGQVAVNGEAFDGNGLFKFALVNVDGTATYWSNDGTSVDGLEPQASVSVPVNGGLYAVLLGNTAQQGMGAIDPAVFTQHTDAKLRVWFSDGVNGFQQLSPDRPFASVPYAFSAGSATIAPGSIDRSMLSGDIRSDLNRTISHNDLSPQIKADINGTIGLDRLSAEVILKLEQNATITNGSVTGSKMADGVVTASKIAKDSVGIWQLNPKVMKYLKPEITVQPQAQTVYADTNATFSVTAEGKYLSYQWKKDGVDLAGETNATLNITDANATLHDGNYSVVVSNDFGSEESNKVEVKISDALLNGLVGWWKFDETSGTVAYDSSGNGNNGNLTGGPTWVTGKIDGALSFDGLDDYVSIPATADLDLANLNISAWINTSNYRQNGFIFEKTSNGQVNSQYNLFFEHSSNSLRWRTTPVSGNYHESRLATNILTSWNFLSASYDGITKKIFLNGNLSKSDSFSGTIVQNPNGISLIGKHPPANYFFNGLIDDVRIYDRALSAEEVQALYNLGQ